MSKLPSPRNIRVNWKERPITVEEGAAEVAKRFKVPDRYGHAVEARAWEMARGWRKGDLKRVDVAYEGEDAFASVRLSGGFFSTKVGSEAAK